MGLHGANRLASNSLLETVVFAKRVVRRTLDSPGKPAKAASDARPLGPADLVEAPPADRTGLQALMWKKVGIIRDGPTLAEAARTLAAWEAALPASSDRPSHELANLVLVGRLVTEAALEREESRGAHYRRDFPETRPEWLRHIVFRHV